MLSKYPLAIPVNTPASAPFEIAANLASGNWSQVVCVFPAGCEGLVGIRILHGLFQVWPLTSDSWIVGDDHTFEDPVNFVLEPGVARLRIMVYNLDLVNVHTISVHVNVDSIEDVSKKRLGLVTAELPESVVKDIAAISKIYENALEFRTLIDEKMLPLLDGIWERLDPQFRVRLKDLSLEELSRL